MDDNQVISEKEIDKILSEYRLASDEEILYLVKNSSMDNIADIKRLVTYDDDWVCLKHPESEDKFRFRTRQFFELSKSGKKITYH